MSGRFARFNRKFAPAGLVFIDAARVRVIEPTQATEGNTAIHIDTGSGVLTVYVNETPTEVFAAISAISP